MKKLSAALVLGVLLVSCWDLRRKPTEYTSIMGYKAVYTQDSSVLDVKTLAPQPIVSAGKIYVKDHFILQNEMGRGIHVINNTDPATADRVGFIQLLGNTEISIKGNYLYANSFADLVVIDISDWQHPIEVSRVPYAFVAGDFTSTFPLPERNVYYECYGQSTGIMTGWVKDTVTTGACFYN